ncbi:MAG: hypothetical protein K1X89_09635 [Myxococcaceae bacterium]|nr:hypothetical protein [Myxococcaceae bacterium]
MMLALALASTLTAYTPSARLLTADDAAEQDAAAPSSASAIPQSVSPGTPVPPAAYVPPPTPPQPRKSVSFLLAGGEFVVGAATGYLGLLLGILGNFRSGGLTIPPDVTDILLLAALPAGLATAGAWLIGLFDLSQRGFFSNLFFAVLGGALGELVGVGAGVLVGRSAAPSDSSLAGIIAVSMGPAFAALGAMFFMELFKPGELPAHASVLFVPDGRGGLAAGPSLIGHF